MTRAAAALLLAAATVCGTGCAGRASGDTTVQALAIERFLLEDDGLGAVRDRRSETAPLHVAVEEYLIRIDSLDCGRCPAEFRAAFRAHRDAWASAIPVLRLHDTLRGEMHVLFDRIRALGAAPAAALDSVERPIWATWDVVEAVAARFGVAGTTPN